MKNKSFCSRFFYTSFALFLLGASQGLSASLSLADALDTTNVIWMPSAWLPQTNLTHDGVDAAWGEISSSGDNPVLEAAVTGPAHLSFWWRCLSDWPEIATPIVFYFDGELIAITNSSDWSQVSFSVPPGTHVLRWRFEAYEIRFGDAALVDAVTIEPIDDTTGPPLITGQPRNKTAVVGTTIFFNAFAGGSPPLYLQWLFEGNPIPDATNTFLVLRNVQLTNAGNYTLRVTNALGATVSPNGVLTVNATDALTEALDDPTLNWRGGWGLILEDTHDGIDAASGVVSCTGLSWLETTVIGPGSFSFWWKGHSRSCDGGYVSFSTDYGLVAGYAGDFDWEHHAFAVPLGIHTLRWEVYAGSECVGAQAWLDQVSFDPNGPYPPTIVKAPRTQAVSQGDDVLFSVQVDGCEPLAYQWYLNGQALPGETGARLLFTNVHPSYAGNYSVTISNLLQTIASQPAALSVGPMPLNWDWARQAGGSNYDSGQCIAIDNAGYIYVAGGFRRSALVGTNLLSSTNSEDIFMAKYDSDGNVIEARQICAGYPHSMLTDSAGNIYLAGTFNGSVNFGPATLTASGPGDLFLAKYNAAGNCVWVRQAGRYYNDVMGSQSCLALDPSGNVYFAGTFMGTFTVGTYTFSSQPYYPAFFLAKFDGAGNVIWATAPTGTYGITHYSLAVDKLSNAYVSGTFHDTVDFGTTNLIGRGQYAYDFFLAKYNSAGALAWVKQDLSASPNRCALGVDGQNNLIVHGGFSGTLTLGTNFLTTSSTWAGYMAKWDPSGGVIWARGLPQELGTCANPQIPVDSSGGIYLGYTFYRYFECDDRLLLNDGTGMFLAKFDSEGRLEWLKDADAASAYPCDIAAGAAGEIYITGSFYTFGGPGDTFAYFGTNALVSLANSDCYLAKLTPRSRPRLNAQLQTGTPGLRLHLTCEIGRIYSIETSTDLHTWTPFVTVTNLTGEVQFTDTDPTPPTKRFYRAREQ